VAAATVVGRLAGGGRLDDSTRETGADDGTVPVTSFDAPRDANGFSLNRVASELHPAAPMAMAATAIARGQYRERNNATTEDMVNPLVRNKLCDELTPAG
jgi:hypothetical protein